MSDEQATIAGIVCPSPIARRDRIVMGHGSGGKLSHDLIEKLFLPPFDNPVLRAGDDAGVVPLDSSTRLAISTDSHVVWPLFFPGGDIGRLAGCGDVKGICPVGGPPPHPPPCFVP